MGLSAGQVALQFAVLGVVSVTLNTLADLLVAVVAGRAHAGLGGRSGLVCRLREVLGGAIVLLGLGLVLARWPAN